MAAPPVRIEPRLVAWRLDPLPARRRGFMLGKFMPPHRGHVFLAETAAGLVDELTVLVCSHDGEPIPGTLRHDWMMRLVPGARVLHMHRDIPQEPAEHPGFWPIWRAAIRAVHPEPIDAVFGSEPYVVRLADELGAEPCLIDPGRGVFGVSGRAIRADPARHWDFIPPLVRPYFQRRVTILGPESTGKTTLANALALRLGTRPMPEYGRTFDAHYRRGAGWRAADFVTLARTHRAMRRAMAPDAGPLLIEDTDALQTAAWAEFLLGVVPAELDELIATEPPADLALLLAPDVPWVDDGTRYSGAAATRTWFFEHLRARLEAAGARYTVIAGADWTARTEAAMSAVDHLAPARSEECRNSGT